MKDFDFRAGKFTLLNHGESGINFDNVFGDYLNNDVKMICLVEPYLRTKFQHIILTKFLEFLASNCKTLESVEIVSSIQYRETLENSKYNLADDGPMEYRPIRMMLRRMSADLFGDPEKIQFYNRNHIHARSIVISTGNNVGIHIQLDRGIHIYEQPLDPPSDELELAQLFTKRTTITPLILDCDFTYDSFCEDLCN